MGERWLWSRCRSTGNGWPRNLTAVRSGLDLRQHRMVLVYEKPAQRAFSWHVGIVGSCRKLNANRQTQWSLPFAMRW